MYGKFITAVINFLIMAFVIFLIVKLVNKVMSLGKKTEPEEAPATKKCPFCFSEIDIKATKCPHCTGNIIDLIVKTDDKK
jgi:large conductance mechanosensitive channel